MTSDAKRDEVDRRLARLVEERRGLAASLDRYDKHTRLLDALLKRALELLHDIGGNYYARRALKQTNLTAPLRASMQDKALTDEQIEKLCLDNWEAIVLELSNGHVTRPGGALDTEQKP